MSVTLVQSLFLRLKLMENYVWLMTSQWRSYLLLLSIIKHETVNILNIII